MPYKPRHTPAQERVYKLIKNAGESGISMDELCAILDVTRQALYSHINPMLDTNRVYKVKVGRNILYKTHRGSTQHVLPGFGDIDAGTTAEYLNAYLDITDLNNTQIVKTVKTFPWWLSQMAQFARRWKSSDRQMQPSKEEVDACRMGLLQVSSRALHLHKMAQSLLDNEALWHSRNAQHLWYNDPGIPVDDELVRKWSDHIFNLVNPPKPNA